MTIKNAEEIWKPVIQWKEYEVSSYGRIRSLKNGRIRILKPCLMKNGYQHVKLHSEGKPSNVRVHKLVMEAFIGYKEIADQCIDHVNSIRHDNRLENLRYMDFKQNILIGKSPPAINAKKTHCPNGHSYTIENLCRWYLPWRKCRICHAKRTSRNNKKEAHVQRLMAEKAAKTGEDTK